MNITPDKLVERLAERLGFGGVDIVTPLALSWYNSSIPDALGARIPARGVAGDSALCVLVGNSRSMWEAFLQACAAEGLLQQDNPLEVYLEQRLCAALNSCAPGLPHRMYWSHRRTDDLVGGPEGKSEHVAFQRMAHHAGLAYLDETSHLCMHPRFGPWFSLRCVVIFDNLAYTAPQPAELHNPLPLATQQYVALALNSAVHNTSRKFRLPEVDVEAAEAVLCEASMEPVLLWDGDAEEEEHAGQPPQQQLEQGMVLSHGRGPVRCPGSSGARTTVGSEEVVSGGTTPACSSGVSSPQAGLSEDEEEAGQEDVAAKPAPQPAGPEEECAGTAEARLAAAPLAVPVAVPAAQLQAQASAGGSGFGSPLQVGSVSSTCSRRSSLERESKPSMRAVAANWKAWVAVRDAPCPGHPWRYSEEQIRYHYTRDRSILLKALLRRNLAGPGTPPLPVSGLLDPALASFHQATMQAHSKAALRAQLQPPSQCTSSAAAVGAGAAPCAAAPAPAAITAP